MTTAELTADINLLTTAEKRQVRRFIRELLSSRRDTTNPVNLPKYTVEDVLQFVEESEKERQKGTLIPYKKAITTARKKYGIPA